MYFVFVVGLRLLVEVMFEVVDIELFLYECMLDIDGIVLEYGFGLIDGGALSEKEQSAHGFDRIEPDHKVSEYT